MADKTKNIGLTMPLPEEFYDVAVQNKNMEILDEEVAGKIEKNKIITTKEELEGVKETGYIADAKVVKEEIDAINGNLIALKNNLNSIDYFDIVGMTAGFGIVYNSCMFNAATGKVDLLIDFTCNGAASGEVLMRVPERYRPAKNVRGIIHSINGTASASTICTITTGGNITQGASSNCTKGMFQFSYYKI